MASAKQLAHQRKVKAFYAKHGRFPKKGELGRAVSSSSTSSRSSGDDAAAAKRRRAAKKAAKTRGTWHYKAKKAVTDHPVRTVLAGIGLGGAAHRPTRQAAGRLLAGGMQRVRLLLPR